MTDDTQARISTQTLGPDTEIYNRDDMGRLSPRLGFVGDFLRTVNITQVQHNVVMLDQASVVEALNVLPMKLHRRSLEASYQAIVNSFRTATHNNLPPMLMRTIELCNEKAPDFRIGLEDELQAIDPNKYYSTYKNTFKETLDQLRTASDAYTVVLSLGFHALTLCSPTTAMTETVNLEQIDQAIEILTRKLKQTLIPNGEVKGSLLLATLINPKDNRFSHYLPYYGVYNSPAGLQSLLSKANESRFSSDGVSISPCEESRQHALLADTLVDLISSFQLLLNGRRSYSSTLAAEPDSTTAIHGPASGG